YTEYIIDFNGDSYLDILYFWKKPTQLNRHQYFHVFLNKGDGTYSERIDTYFPNQNFTQYQNTLSHGFFFVTNS
ncbi:MAG: hypothetical protein GY739_17410, partial [Mesoflavibacter sp.]|nr:hypothetical protein [Mesoflavibacter sp.]